MRTWIKSGLLASGALRIAADFRAPSAAILMYHSVLPDPDSQSDTLGGIVHSESAFFAQMELVARNYRPLSLDQLVRHLSNGEDPPPRAVVVTFDDGYADNYDIAMPVLNHFSIPATFYITVDCVENRKLPWPSRLRYVFRRTKLVKWIDPDSRHWNLETAEQREKGLLLACDLCCELSGAEQEHFVRCIEEDLECCAPSEMGSLMMDYDQLRRLTCHGHVVGSHTMTHPNMAHLKEDNAYGELAGSKQRLESQLKMVIKHFSYPCPALSPHWTDRTVEQSRAVGYESAVTTDSRLTHRGDNLLCLPRIRPTKTVEGLRWNLECAFAGRAV